MFHLCSYNARFVHSLTSSEITVREFIDYKASVFLLRDYIRGGRFMIEAIHRQVWYFIYRAPQVNLAVIKCDRGRLFL